MLATAFDFLGIYGIEDTNASQWNVDLNGKVTTTSSMMKPPMTMAIMVIFMATTLMGIVVILSLVHHGHVCDGHCGRVNGQGYPVRFVWLQY